MAYAAKKERSFKQPGEVKLLPQRSESRLKTYSSATDARCWTDECEDRRQYILDIIKTGHQKSMGKYVPIDAIIATLLANKNAEINDLKKKLDQVGGVLTDDKKSQLKELTQRDEPKKGDSPRSYAESAPTETEDESRATRSEKMQIPTPATTSIPTTTPTPTATPTPRSAMRPQEGGTCQEDIEMLEREIDAMRASSLTPDQEAELMQKELRVLRNYCEKLANIQEENERLKQGADSNLYEENNVLKERVEELQNRLRECCNEIVEEKDKVEQLQDEVEHYGCQLGEHAEEKNWLKSRVCQLQDQLQKVEAENGELKKQTNNIMIHHEEIVRERQCLKAKVCHLQKQLRFATVDIKMEEKLRHHEEVVQERNCLRARICQLETQLIASGKLSEFESYCAQLMEKVQHHEAIVQERNCLRARVCQLEEELKCFQDLPEKLAKYKQRSSVLDDYESERQEVQERLSQFADLEKEVLELRKSSNKAECLQKALEKCQEELKKVRCCSKNMEMELEQTQCIMESLKAERDVLRDKYEADVPIIDAADVRTLLKDREDLRKRVDELGAIESEFMELLEKSRCYETVKAERDTYKAKYDEMVGIELEADYMKDQLEQAKKIFEERDALVTQIRECECCIQDQETEIKTLVTKVETLSQQQENSEKKIECLREQLIEKNELIKASEEQLKNLQDQLSGTIKDMCGEKTVLKTHIYDLEECQKKGECELECIKIKLKEKTLMIESLQRKEECCKAAYSKLKEDVEQYMSSCQCAYDKIKELAAREEAMQNTVDQLQNELEEKKKIAEDANDENKSLIAENAQLKCDMARKNEELKQLKCEIIDKEEAVGKIKSFLLQKDELCRCIFEKLRSKICFLTEENEKLRKVAKDLADASGDQHLTDLMQKSYATAEKLNEELCRQFNEWDRMRNGNDKLELLRNQNKKMKASLKETKLCLLRYQRENEFLRQAAEKGGQADEMYLNQLRDLNEKILNLENDNENLRKGIGTASKAMDDSCQFLQTQLCDMQQGGICKSSAEVCSKLKDQLEKARKDKEVVEQLVTKSSMNNEDDLGSICDCTTLRKKLECVKQENRLLKNQIKGLAKQLGNTGNECECQKLKELLEGRSVDASFATEEDASVGLASAGLASAGLASAGLASAGFASVGIDDPCFELRRQIQDLQGQNQELQSAITKAGSGVSDALNSELERLKALLNEKNKSETDLQAELDRLRGLLRDKDSSVDDLKAELDKLRAQLQEKSSTEGGLKSDVDNLKAELERLRAQLKQREDEIAKAKGDLSKCDDLRKDLEDLKARLAQAQKERDEAARKLADLQSENDKLKSDLQQKLAELQKLQSENSQLKGDLQKAKDDADRAQNELSRLQAENSQLKNDLQRAKNEAAELQQQISKLQSENDKLKTDLQKAQDEAAKKLADLQKELERLNSENANLKKAQDEAARKLADLESALNNLTAENNKLKGDLQRAQDEAARKIAGLEAELGKLQSENNQLKTDLKRAQDDAAAKLADLQNELSKLKEENGHLKKDLQQAKDDAAAKLAELKNQFDKLQAENSKLKDDIQRVQDEAARKLANLEKELAVLGDQNKQLMKEKADLENEKSNLKQLTEDLRGQAANQQELNTMRKERDDLLAQLEALKKELANCAENMKKAQEACQAELDKARKDKDSLQGMLDQMQGKLAEAGQKPVGRSSSELERLLEEERRKNAAFEKTLADMKGADGGDSNLDALLDKEAKQAAEALKELANTKQKLADLEADNQRLLDELEKCRKAKKDMEDEYNHEKDRLNELYENALKGQISEDEDALRKELERLRAELNNCKKKYEENIGLLKNQHGSQIKEMDRKFSDGVAKMQVSHEEIVKDMSKDHENELENLRKELKKCHDLVCCLRKKIKNLEEKLKQAEEKDVASKATEPEKKCLCKNTTENVNITAMFPCINKGVGADLKKGSLDASCECGQQPTKKNVGCTCRPKKQDVACICYTEELGVDTTDRGTSKDTDGEGAHNIHKCLCGKPFETILFKIITKGIEIITLKELQLVNTEINCAITKKSGQEKGVEAKLSSKTTDLPKDNVQSQTSFISKPKTYAERIKELEEDLQRKQKCAKQKAVALSMAVKIEKEHLDELKKALDIEKQRNKELMERIGIQTKTVTNLQVESDIMKKQNYFSQEKINDLRGAIEEERSLCRSLKAELEKERNCSRYLKSMLQSGQGKSCPCQPKEQDDCQLQGKLAGKGEGQSRKATCLCRDDKGGKSGGKDQQKSRSHTPKDRQ